MNKKLEIITVIVAFIIAAISSVVVIVGFFTNNVDMIINSSRFLSLSALGLVIYFSNNVYQEMFTDAHEVRMELRSKEDVEEFRKKLDKELQQYIKQIAEEEELDKDKDE